MLRRLWEKIKLLWKLAKSERATPREIGWAVFLGVLSGCTPAVGFHGPVAVGLASVFRKNRLFAWLGSRVSNMLILPFIALAEVQLAHRVRTGAWVAVDREHAVARAGELMLDWCLGTIPVGVALGAVLGSIAWGLAHRRDRKKKEKEAAATPPPPAEALRPSSGSPS